MTAVDSNSRSSRPVTSADAVNVAESIGLHHRRPQQRSERRQLTLAKVSAGLERPPRLETNAPAGVGAQRRQPNIECTARSALLAVNSTRPSARPSMATSPATIENVPVGWVGEPATSNSTEASSRCSASAADDADDRGAMLVVRVRTETASFSPCPEIRMCSMRRSMLPSSRSDPSPRFRRRPVTCQHALREGDVAVERVNDNPVRIKAGARHSCRQPRMCRGSAQRP